MRRWLLALAVASGVWASGAAAQEATTAGPRGAEAAVQAYSDAVVASDWEAAAERMDPRGLKRIRDLARLIAESDPFTASLLGIEPEASAAELLSAFVGVAIDEIPGMDVSLATSESRILGTVLEGDSLAHVLMRTDMVLLERPISTVDLTTARWSGERWLVALSEEIEGVIIGMEAVIENPELFGIEDDYEEGFFEMDTAQPRDPKKQ